jgi:ribonuclease R
MKGKVKAKAKPESVKKHILEAYHDAPSRVYNYKQMARRIGLNTHKGKSMVQHALAELAEDGALLEEDRGKFRLDQKPAITEGVIDFTQRGSAYVKVEGQEKDVFIGKKQVGKALHGDRVKIRMYPDGRKKFKGDVLEVLERRRTEFVGSIQKMERYAFLLPDDPRVNVDFFIPIEKLRGAKNKQKVIAKLGDWPANAGSPYAEVIQVLGDPGENDTEMFSILTDYGFPLDFPEKVKEDAAKIPTEITPEEVKKREDFRDITTFTIDPVDAKDFDDALSIRRLENGNIEVGVHIADVTHYVRPGTQLEKEAKDRATSIYLVDRVIPMLPEELSNVVCSLRPHEEKLTFSCIFELTEKAEVKNYRIGRTVIHSDHRFTYEEVQEILEGKEGDFEEELRGLNALAQQLRANRMKQGSIAFDKIEVRFELDEKKKPVGVFFKTQKDAHKLIEEFMLLANRTVAEHIANPKKRGQKPKPFVFRIHDDPDPEKLAQFSQFIRRFGYDYNFSKGNISENMNNLLGTISGKREENIIENLAIRTMAKAEYSTQNIGHYGLHFDYYSHFTSPIRRYPDMMAHRLLAQYAEGNFKVNEEDLEYWCKHSSEMEQKATNAERDSTKFFQVLYMQDTEGQEFDGFVSGMSEWGVYVELEESKCEGMIRLRDLQGDYFYFDEDNFQVVGNNSGAVINLGAKLRIKVLEADLVKRRLDFGLVEVLEN